MILNLGITLLIFSNNVFFISAQTNEFKLELVQVLFRHGDRVAGKNEIYKTDPYDSVFRKHGYGQLTKTGLQREYKIGQMLRERYNDFLGETDPKQVYGFSTELDRTKVSLQLVLAGLYPPTAKTAWNKDIPWIPIPTHTKEKEFNFLSVLHACPTFMELFKELEDSVEIQEKLKKYDQFYEHIRNETKITSKRPFVILRLFNNIHSALSLGLKFPGWMKKEDYNTLQEITSLAYDCMTYTTTMRRYSVGPMIDEFVKNINNSENNDNERKIYLYSAHDVNIAIFNRAHNMTNAPILPNFGSALMMEKLRGNDNQIYIRFVLWTGVTEEIIPLKMKDCNVECPLSDYLKIMKDVFPDEEVRKCIGIEKICHSRQSRVVELENEMELKRELQSDPTTVLSEDDDRSFKYADGGLQWLSR